MDRSDQTKATQGEQLSAAAFDGYASEYDADFTDASIGVVQRKVVHEYLSKHFKKTSATLRVLELNGGTGADACFLAKRGFKVTYTDVSDQMLLKAKQRAEREGVQENIEFALLDMSFPPDWPAQQYDLVFSDFGGLNCLSPAQLEKLGAWMHRQLKPDGRLVAVVMPKQTAWEMLYFGLKLQFGKAFRRWGKGPVEVTIPDGKTNVWYYNPALFEQLLQPHFKRVEVKSTAVYVPPSYLQNWVDRKPARIQKLERRDRKILHKKWTTRFSDHYLMDLKRVEG